MVCGVALPELSTAAGSELSRRSCECLLRSCLLLNVWLNDELVNFYLRLTRQRGILRPVGPLDLQFVFPTTTWAALQTRARNYYADMFVLKLVQDRARFVLTQCSRIQHS